MKKRYIKDGYATSYLQYLIIFCTRFRRKVFLIPGVSIRFKELATDVCKKMNIRIDSVICDTDHVLMKVVAPPDISVKMIVFYIKAATSKIMQEFEELNAMQSLWTFSYMASTSNITDKEINAFVTAQKKRPETKSSSPKKRYQYERKR